MTNAFGYTVAIVLAAVALRRIPVELCRWRARRRSRLLCRTTAGEELRARNLAPTRPHAAGGGRAGGGGRFRHLLRRALDDAVVPCSEPQAIAVWGAAVAVGTCGGLILAPGAGAAAGAGVGLLGPPLVLWAARRRRARLVVEALPGFLERVARSLRAGVSTVAAMEEALPPNGPMAADLRGLMGDVSVGRSLPAALDSWRERHPLPEVNLAAAALSIGATSGGRRAPAVDGVAATLRENRTAQREVASLAQQGRLSGLMIAVLPLCFLALSAMIDGASMGVLYRTPVGVFCLVTGIALNIVAFVWMHRITRLR